MPSRCDSHSLSGSRSSVGRHRHRQYHNTGPFTVSVRSEHCDNGQAWRRPIIFIACEGSRPAAGPITVRSPTLAAAALLHADDGTLPRSNRGLACERGLLNRADGSAKWTQDSSSVLAAVYGPRQAQLKNEDAEHAVVEVVFKPRSGFQGAPAPCMRPCGPSHASLPPSWRISCPLFELALWGGA